MTRAHVPDGFTANEPQRALELARREKRLLLIDFYAIWCPPCNELDEYTYPDPLFRAAASDFVKVALDADAEVSFAWKARFKVGGYPTIILADHELREIGRFVGVKHGPAAARWLAEMSGLRSEPLAQAARRVARDGAAADPRRTLRVANWHAERAEFAQARDLLARLSTPDAELLGLQIQLEEGRRSEDQAARKLALRRLTERFPEHSEFPYWASMLASVDSDTAKGLIGQMRSSVKRWSSPELAPEAEHIPVYMAQFEASFMAKVTSSESAKPYWDKAATLYAEQARKSPLPFPRSASFGYPYCLQQAGRKSEAMAYYAEAVKAYPEEFTFNFEYADALNDEGRREAAYPYAVKAAEKAYGDNWLRAVRLKAELELRQGRTAEAAATVDEALAQTEAPRSTEVRTFRYITELRALRAEIAAAAAEGAHKRPRAGR